MSRLLLPPLLFALPLSSCICLDVLALLDDPPPADLPSPSGDASPDSVQITEAEIERIEACIGNFDAMDDAELDAAFSVLDLSDAPPAEGTVDLPLNAVGCFRVARVVEGGAVRDLRFYAHTGIVAFQDDVWRASIVTLARFATDSDGVITGSIQRDDDPYDIGGDSDPEVTTRDDPATRKWSVERKDPESRAVVYRLTVEARGDDVVQRQETADSDRTLVAVESIVNDENAGQAVDCAETAGTTCTPEQTQRLEQASKDALKQLDNCLTPTRQDNFEQLLLLKNRWMRKHEWRCLPSTCTSAIWCDT